MTKHLGLILGVGVLGSIASLQAAVAPPACSTQSAASLAGYTCEIGDKIFSNISLTGTNVPTTGTVSFAGAGTLYSLDFANYGNPIATAFTFAFTVAVDTATNPNNRIIQVQDQMITSTLTGVQLPNTSTAQVTHTPGNAVSLTGTASGQGGLSIMNTISETVSFAYTPGADGKLADVTFGISQTTVPEPMTLSMMGIGLLSLGLMRRRQQGKK